MFSAKQYRAKAAELRGLLADPLLSTKEASEFRNLEQSYTTLAENEEWLVVNIDKTLALRQEPGQPQRLVGHEKQI